MSSSRRSQILLSRIVDETDEHELEKKRRDLERAICDEFLEIFERQNDFENRLLSLEKSEEMNSPIRLKSHEDTKLIDLQQQIEATADSSSRIMKELTLRVETLERENKKLIAQNKDLMNRIEANSVDEELIRLNRESRDLHSEIETLKKKTNQKHVTSGDLYVDRIAKINIEIPKFKGTFYERPIKFLNELESYITIKRASFNEIKLILSQSLENEAKDWWYINEDEIDSFEEFADSFKERFWCSSTQRKLKRKIECGQYITGGKTSRASYATHLFSIAKDLDSNYDDEELIKLISEQYDREIKFAIKSNAKNKNDLFNILAEFDSDDKQLKEKNREKPQNSRNSNTNQNSKILDKQNKDFHVRTTELKNETIQKQPEKKRNFKEKSKIEDKNKLAYDLYKNIDILDIDLDRGNEQ